MLTNKNKFIVGHLIMDDDFDQQISILLLGESGSGKTSLIRALFGEDTFSCVHIPSAGVDTRLKNLELRDDGLGNCLLRLSLNIHEVSKLKS